MKSIGLYSVCWKAVFVVFICAFYGAYGFAQSCSLSSLDVVYQKASASTNIGAFAENSCDPSIPPNYYLQETIVSTGSGQDNYQYYSDYRFDSASFATTETLTFVAGADCSTQQINWSGNATYESGDNYEGTPYFGSESATMDNSGTWSDGGYSYSDANTFIASLPAFTQGPSQCTATLQTSTSSGSGSSSGPNSSSGWSGQVFNSTSLSDLVTPQLLRGLVNVPGFTGPWTTNAPKPFGSAILAVGLGTCSSVQAGKLEYFFHIGSCQPEVSYLVTWDQVTTNPDGSTSIQSEHETITGNGDPVNGANGSIHTVDVPQTPSTIHEANIKMKIIPSQDPGS